MEEADALADYIVIMDEGKVHPEAQGTPFDLKKKFSMYSRTFTLKSVLHPKNIFRNWLQSEFDDKKR